MDSYALQLSLIRRNPTQRTPQADNLFLKTMKKHNVILSAEQRQRLLELIAAGKTSAQKLAHARILFAVAACIKLCT